MRVTILLLAALAAANAQDDDAGLAAADQAPSDIVQLNLETFDEVVKETPLMMIAFTAPWCGACKKLLPDFDEAATELKGKAVLAQFNSWDERHVAINKRYDVSGYPTIWIIRDGVETEYHGDRDKASIVRIMRRMARPAVTTIEPNVDSVLAFIEQNRDPELKTVSVVAFFASREFAEFESFLETARELRDQYAFGLVVGGEFHDTEFQIHGPTAIIFKDFEEHRVRVEGHMVSMLKDILPQHRFPLFNEINKANYRDYVDTAVPLLYIFVQTPEQRESLEQTLRPIADHHRRRLHYVFIDWVKYGDQAEKLGLSGKVVPALAIENVYKKQHFAFDETKPITPEDVSAWTLQFLSGQLAATIRSEPVPETQDGPVVKVVADNFADIVQDPTKDVFLEVYAPWCGHCKKLRPVWEELATSLKDVPSITIAAVDATVNDLEESLSNSGFPTLMFYPAFQKNPPIHYTSKDRSLKSLQDFVKQHATYKSQVLPVLKDEL